MMYQDGISEIYKAKVLKISPTSFPAPMNILQELQIPAIEHEKSSGWSPLMTGEIIVDDAENIKTLIACNKSPETHWSYATISKGKSNIKVLDHSLSQRLIFSNRKAEAFIWVWEGYLYKWN
jgi:hypothetical protein